MMRRQWAFSCAFVLSAAAAAACGDDTTNVTPLPVADGGPDGTAPDAATIQDAGSDAASAADASVADTSADATVNDAGADGTTADSATEPDANEGGTRDTGTVTDAADASDGGPPSYAIFVGTDFSSAEFSAISLNANAIVGDIDLTDEDSVAYSSGGLGFVLERSTGFVLSLDPNSPDLAVRANIDVNDSLEAGTYASNPHAVVVTAGTQGYVARYSSNVVTIIDIASGAKTGTIDLSAFVAPDDPDGLVDVTDGVYDPVANRAYLLLQRTDQNAIGQAPDYVTACLASHPEIVAIDPTTNAVVPLTDAGNGAIDLLGDFPEAIVADFANGRILVAEGGCYGNPDGGDSSARFGRGVESIALASTTPTWLYQTSDVNLVSGLILVDSTHAYLEVGGQWFPWNPTQTTLGDVAIANFPLAPFYDGAGRIVGLWQTQPDAGSDAGTTWSVVAMSTATQSLSTLVTAPFKSVSPDPTYGVTSAFVR
jgi:hypothetical protein